MIYASGPYAGRTVRVGDVVIAPVAETTTHLRRVVGVVESIDDPFVTVRPLIEHITSDGAMWTMPSCYCAALKCEQPYPIGPVGPVVEV